MLSRLGFDALAALTLALTALLGAYTPAFLARRDKLAGGTGRSLVYVLGNMFSAGVMVSAGFCHLLGEALKQMPKMQFPMAPFLCGAGYMLTLVADKVVASATGHGGGGCGHAGMPGKGPAVDSCCAVEVLAGVDIAERGAVEHGISDPTEVCGLLERTPSPVRGRRQNRGTNGSLAHAGLPVVRQPGGGLASRQGSGGSHGHAHGDHEHISAEGVHERSLNGSLHGAGAGTNGVDAGGRRGGLNRDSSDSLVFEVEPEHGSDGPLLSVPAGGGSSGQRSGGRSVSFLTAMLMGVALCFHSLLEGAAMGAQPTISNSLHIFIAIVSHKGLAAYALGSSIVDSEASMRRFWSVVLPFTFASPAGIFLGFIVSDIAKGVGAASISALASGTFLYVAFMEVIPREMREPAHIPSKLLALLAGFFAMSVLAIWA